MPKAFAALCYAFGSTVVQLVMHSQHAYFRSPALLLLGAAVSAVVNLPKVLLLCARYVFAHTAY